ncbi:hypothetical protein BGW41_007192 [Actinomortierella wolfii]|nr:hypothetical protein BGW41_007192 [Actinomortierella wolfii]
MDQSAPFTKRRTLQPLLHYQRFPYHRTVLASPISSLLILGLLANFGLLSYNGGNLDDKRFNHLARAQGSTSRPVPTFRPPVTTNRPPPLVTTNRPNPPTQPPVTNTVVLPTAVPPIQTTTTTIRTFSDNVITVSRGPTGGSSVPTSTRPTGTPYSNKLPEGGDTTMTLIITLAVIFVLLGGVCVSVCWLLRRRSRKRRMLISGLQKNENDWALFGGDEDTGGNTKKDASKNRSSTNARSIQPPMTQATTSNGRLIPLEAQELRRLSSTSMGTGAGTGTLHGSGFEMNNEKLGEHYRHSGDLSSLPIELPPTPLESLHPGDHDGRRRSNISLRSSMHSPYLHPQSSSPHPSAHRMSTISYNNPYGGGGGDGQGGGGPYPSGGGTMDRSTSRAQSPAREIARRSSMDVLDSTGGPVMNGGEYYHGPEKFRHSQYDRPNSMSGMNAPSPMHLPQFDPRQQQQQQQQYRPHPGHFSSYGYSHPQQQDASPQPNHGTLSRQASFQSGVPYIPPPNHPHRYSQQLPYPSYHGPPHTLDRSKTMNYRHSQPFLGTPVFQPSSPYQLPMHPSGVLHPQTGETLYGSVGYPTGGGGMMMAGVSDSETIASSNSGSKVSRAGSSAAVMIRPKSGTASIANDSNSTLPSAFVSGGPQSTTDASSSSSPSVGPTSGGVGVGSPRLESSATLAVVAEPRQQPQLRSISPRASAELTVRPPSIVVARRRVSNSSLSSAGAAVTIAPPPTHSQQQQQQQQQEQQEQQPQQQQQPVSPEPLSSLDTLGSSRTPSPATSSESKEELSEEYATEESFHVLISPPPASQ